MSVIASPEATSARAEDLKALPAWPALKSAVIELQQLQAQDGSVPEPANHGQARDCVSSITRAIEEMRAHLLHDSEYLGLLVQDFRRWESKGFAKPDFLDSLVAFHPERQRINGLPHLVVFPDVYTERQHEPLL
jgi:hypothetical protein